MVKGFGDRQRRGLKAVPGSRLLLESDSPHLLDVAGSSVQGGGGGRSGEGSVSFGHPPGRYCQWAGSVPEEIVRLAQRGEFKITER
jgi:Tat protein secretion system quality control protein TatD with DNase activity